MSDILKEKAKAIRLVIFDVDGILTDGKITYNHEALEHKSFHVHDGLGMKLLQKSGVQIAIITARKSISTEKRMNSLGIIHVYQGVEDKLSVYEELKNKLALTDEQIAYAGDDLPDLPVLRRVGLSITVANATPFIRERVHWITQSQGGLGAGREICDFILTAQDNFDAAIQPFLDR